MAPSSDRQAGFSKSVSNLVGYGSEDIWNQRRSGSGPETVADITLADPGQTLSPARKFHPGNTAGLTHFLNPP